MDPFKIAQLFPATPTALPPPPPLPGGGITINPNAWRMWTFVDEAIMVWQQITPARTQVLQVAIIMGIIIMFIFLAIRWVQGLTDEGNL